MDKYIIDANVVLLAGATVRDIPTEQLICAQKCLRFIQNFMTSDGRLVLDAEGRILKEYRNAYSLGTNPNVATEFYKWVCMHIPKEAKDFIPLTEISENVFQPYPDSEQLEAFDPPDRKYIALAYIHEEKPPIAEASDSKWWGIKEEMQRNGLKIFFIDEEYIKNKYRKKME